MATALMCSGPSPVLVTVTASGALVWVTGRRPKSTGSGLTAKPGTGIFTPVPLSGIRSGAALPRQRRREPPLERVGHRVRVVGDQVGGGRVVRHGGTVGVQDRVVAVAAALAGTAGHEPAAGGEPAGRGQFARQPRQAGGYPLP